MVRLADCGFGSHWWQVRGIWEDKQEEGRQATWPSIDKGFYTTNAWKTRTSKRMKKETKQDKEKELRKALKELFTPPTNITTYQELSVSLGPTFTREEILSILKQLAADNFCMFREDDNTIHYI
jgi:hypothetical protein